MSDDMNPLDRINGILEKQKKQQVNSELTTKLYKNSSISSEKMLLNYTSDNPRIFHTTLKDIFNAHVAVETKLTDGFSKAFPIIIVFALVMGFVILISNLPQIIDAVAKNIGVEKRIVTENVYVLDGKVLTKDELTSKGISLDPTTNTIVPLAPPPVAPVDTTVPVTNTSRCPAGTTDINGECKKSGFDIIGNLAPKPIPLKTPTITKTNKPLCDAGSVRAWNTSVAKWYCIDQQGVATPQKIGYTE